MLSLLFGDEVFSVKDVLTKEIITYFDVIPYDVCFMIDWWLCRSREEDYRERFEKECHEGLIMYGPPCFEENLLSADVIEWHKEIRDNLTEEEFLNFLAYLISTFLLNIESNDQRCYIIIFMFVEYFTNVDRRWYTSDRAWFSTLKLCEKKISMYEKSDGANDLIKFYIPKWKTYFAQCYVFLDS